jgi:hypothetical protein
LVEIPVGRIAQAQDLNSNKSEEQVKNNEPDLIFTILAEEETEQGKYDDQPEDLQEQ